MTGSSGSPVHHHHSSLHCLYIIHEIAVSSIWKAAGRKYNTILFIGRTHSGGRWFSAILTEGSCLIRDDSERQLKKFRKFVIFAGVG